MTSIFQRVKKKGFCYFILSYLTIYMVEIYEIFLTCVLAIIVQKIIIIKECQSFLKVGVNEMPVRPIHNDMSTGHTINDAGLLTPLGINTTVTKYPSNQITNNNSSFVVKVIVLAYFVMCIYLVDFPQWSSNCDLNGWK